MPTVYFWHARCANDSDPPKSQENPSLSVKASSSAPIHPSPYPSTATGKMEPHRNGSESSFSDSLPDLQSLSDSDSEYGNSVSNSIPQSQSESDGDNDIHIEHSDTSSNSMPGMQSISDGETETDTEDSESNDFSSGSDCESVEAKNRHIRNWLPDPSTFSGGIFPLSDLRTGGGKDSLSTCDPPKAIPTYYVDISDSDDSSLDLPQFLASEWIGCDRVWDDDIPKEVRIARNTAREIPTGIFNIVAPSCRLTVAELLSIEEIQTSSSENAAYNVDEPNILQGGHDFDEQLQRCKPILCAASEHAQHLRQQFDKAWLAGAKSIRLPGDPLSRYPLWIERFLADLATVDCKEKLWRNSSNWLASVSACAVEDFSDSDDCTADLVANCYRSWEDIPWDSVVPGFGPAVHLTTKDLAVFLSDQWINDDMINAGSDFIMRQLGQASRVRLVNVIFVEALRNLRTVNNTYAPRRACNLDRLIQEGRLDTLYIPVHVNGNHWTLLVMDLERREYAYADSMNTSAVVPHDVLKSLTWWLDGVQTGQNLPRFTISALNIKMPRQLDSFSCGIAVLSTIAWILLDFTPWSQASFACERMEWFLRLSTSLRSDDVSAINFPLS